MFYNVSLWKKVFQGQSASCNNVIPQFGHYAKLALEPGALPGVLVNMTRDNILKPSVVELK